MPKKLLLGILVLSIFLGYGQTPNAIRDSLSLKENIHLHLNKTTFLQGEHLWFKAYVLDQETKRPSLETTNLHVGIYGEDGRAVKRSLFYVDNGMAQGDFAIDSTFVDNEYTVLAWTNYMRNFKELGPFQQRIKIITGDLEEDSPEVNMKISVYPEGGNLIAGTYNNIGILVDNGLGRGVKVDNLELVDETGQVIRRKVATNHLGMGKLGFEVQEETIYYLRRKGLDGKWVQQRLPRAANEQFGINIDNKESEKVLMEMIGPKGLFKAKDGQTLSLAVYQDDFIGFENFEVNLDKPFIWFPRNQMPHGVLTAVLFDKELKPIAHRMFFNHRTDFPQKDLEIDHCLTRSGDSIQIDLILPNEIGQVSNISLSVLPMFGKANNPLNSIISSFLVQPYVEKGFHDGYYFETDDRQRRFELDKRLLIEGWGKYDWDSRKWEEMKLEFEMENGIPFSGHVADADLRKEQELALFIDFSNTLDYIDLKSDASFEYSAPLFETDSISFSLIGTGGSLRKPRMDWQIEMPFVEENMVRPWLSRYVREPQMNFVSETQVDGQLNLDKRTIALNEVTVSEKRGRNKIIDFSPTTLGRFIGDEEIERHKSLVNFLAGLGFGINGDGGGFNLAIMKYGELRPVPLYVGGLVTEANEIMGMALKDVQYVTYSKTPPNAFVSVVLDQNYVSPERRNQFIKFAIEKGYARPREYFSADYPDYDGQVFKTYGSLDWKPAVSVESQFPTSIILPLKNQKGIKLHIEGMASDGSLVSLSKAISTSDTEERQ